MRGEFVEVGGARLYYYAAGSRGAGEPLLLIHGFPTSSHLWGSVVPLLPTGHRIVVVDLPGYGRSELPPNADLSIDGHAQCILGLMDLLGISSAALVGHDIGGGIAVSLAVHSPARVSRVCLVNPMGLDGQRGFGLRFARAAMPILRHCPASWMLRGLRSTLRRGYVSTDRGTHSIDQYVRPFGSADGHRALVSHILAQEPVDASKLEAQLKHVTAPIAIVWGSDDPFLPRATVERLHRALPHSSLDVVPGARHFVPEETPQFVARVVSGLVQR